MKEPQLGIAIRFMKDWDMQVDTQPTIIDFVMFSCQWLGHTFTRNLGEARCNVCGAVNPQIAPQPETGA